MFKGNISLYERNKLFQKHKLEGKIHIKKGKVHILNFLNKQKDNIKDYWE